MFIRYMFIMLNVKYMFIMPNVDYIFIKYMFIKIYVYYNLDSLMSVFAVRNISTK